MTNKKLISSFIILSLLVGSFFFVREIKAEENGFHGLMLERLTERFGLNKEEVDQVVQEFREERQMEHRQGLEEKLSQAVEEGKLTEEQKQAWLEKSDQWREERERGREEKMSWFEDNGIDPQEIGDCQFGFRGSGFKRDGGFK